MQYRGITLDFYGTLVHEDDHIVSDICGQIAQCTTLSHQKNDIGNRWWDEFCRLMEGAYKESFVPQREIALQSLSETIRFYDVDLDANHLIADQFTQWMAPVLFPETPSFLEWISSINIPVCLVSNIDRVDIEAAMSFNSLQIADVVTSDDVRAYKPRAEIFSAALEMLGLQPEEVLHVGDSRTSDVAGAMSYGIPVAWLNRNEKLPTLDYHPTHTVNDLRGIIQLFQ